MRQPFDGGDLVALMHDGKSQAGIHAAAVDVYRAGAALAVIAALLGAEHVQVFAECVQHRRPRVQRQPVVLTVDVEHNWNRAGDGRRRFLGNLDWGRRGGRPGKQRCSRCGNSSDAQLG